MSRLHECIERENNVERIRELLSAGENPDTIDLKGHAPLHCAVRKIERKPQDVDEILPIISILIDNGSNPNLKNLAGVTPLHLAAMCRNCKTIEVLLQKGADINEKNNRGWSALHFLSTTSYFERMVGYVVIYNTEIDAIQFLLSYDPNVDIRNSARETPLMLAVKYNEFPIVQELLNKNASVSLQDSLGESVMHHILSNVEVKEQMLLKLVQNGGSFSTISFRKQNPMDVYCGKLLKKHSEDAMKSSIVVFRIFLLQNEFNEYQNKCISHICKVGNKSLAFVIDAFRREKSEMSRDQLLPNLTVYHIAVTGLSSNTPDRFPDVVLDKMIKILMTRKYYLYRDLILYGIYDEYMMRKFAETCTGLCINNTLMTYDFLRSMSLTMTKLGMLNMMEISEQIRCNMNLKTGKIVQKCSIS